MSRILGLQLKSVMQIFARCLTSSKYYQRASPVLGNVFLLKSDEGFSEADILVTKCMGFSSPKLNQDCQFEEFYPMATPVLRSYIFKHVKSLLGQNLRVRLFTTEWHFMFQ